MAKYSKDDVKNMMRNPSSAGRYSAQDVKSMLVKGTGAYSNTRDRLTEANNAGADSIASAYSGYNSGIDMLKHSKNVQNAYKNVESFKNQYGSYLTDAENKSIDELMNFYGSAIYGNGGNSIADLTKLYSGYKDADAYNKSIDKQKWANDNKGLTYEQVKQRKALAQGDELEYLNQYGTLVGYNSLADYDAEIADTPAQQRNFLDTLKGFATAPTLKSGEEDYRKSLESARNRFKLNNPLSEYENIINSDDYKLNTGYIENEYTDAYKVDSYGQMGSGTDPTRYGGYQATTPTARHIHTDEFTDETYKWLNDEEYRNSHSNNLGLTVQTGNGNVSIGRSEQHISGYQEMTDEEINVFNYLYNTQGKKAAQEYLDNIQPALQKRMTDKVYQSRIEEAENGGFGTQLKLTGERILGQVPALMGTARNVLDGATTGSYNPYSYEASLYNETSAMAQGVANKIEQNTDWEIGGRNVASFLYNTGLSTADSALGVAMFGPSYSVLMGTGAFQQTAKEMTESGASQQDVWAMAGIAGLAEVVTEYISLDKFEKLIKNGDITGLKKGVLATLRQAGYEGSEELAADVVNFVADEMYNGENSDYNKKIRAYMEQGFSREEAVKKASTDIAIDMAYSFTGGALSGGIMGAGGAVSNYRGLDAEGAVLRNNRNLDAIDEAAGFASDEARNRYLSALNGADSIAQRNNATIASEYNNLSNDLSQGYAQTARENAIDEMRQTLIDNGVVESRANIMAQHYYDNATRGKSLTRYETDMLENDSIRDTFDGIALGTRQESYTESIMGEANRTLQRAEQFNTENMDVQQRNGQTVIIDQDGNETVVNPKDIGENSATYLENASRIEDKSLRQFYIDSYRNTNNIDAEMFDDAFNAVYEAGKKGASLDVYTESSVYTNLLGENTAKKLYMMGMEATHQNAVDMEQKLDEALKGFKGSLKAGTFKSNINYKKLSSRKKSAYKVAQMLSAMGINVEVVDTLNRNVENGQYNADTNTIMINLSAHYSTNLKNDKSRDKYFASALSHELTHWMEANSKEAYAELSAIIRDGMGAYAWDQLTTAEVSRLRNQRGLKEEDATPEELYGIAESEVIARACEDMLNDNEQMIDMLSKADKTTLAKIRDAIKKFFADIRDMIKKVVGDYKSDATEAQLVRNIDGLLGEMQKAWNEAFTQAIAKLNTESKAEQAENTTSTEIDEETGTATVPLNSARRILADEWKRLGYKSYEACIEDVARDIDKKAKIGDVEKVKNWIRAEESIAALILSEENAPYLDYEVDDRYEPVKKNSDYPQGTVDLSNLCRKREIFTRMFDNLQKQNPGVLFTADNIATIRQVLVDSQYEVACALCYVEDRRQNMGEIADIFIDMYKKSLGTKDKKIFKINSSGNEVALLPTKTQAKKYGISAEQFRATDNYIPTQYDLVTYKGFKALTEEHPTIAYAFERYNGSRGMQSARVIEGHAEYARQILKYSDKQVEKINNNGGLRVFSFSDFEAAHLIDICQVITDCAKKGIKIQTYTKVPEFAALVRNTGVKLNRSLIPANVNSKNAYARVLEDGEQKIVKVEPYENGIAKYNGEDVLAFDVVEGIDIRSEYFLDETDNANIGNILIGLSDKQIRMAMNDPFIDYIIPFHTGQKTSVLHAKGISTWKNYKDYQTDKEITPSGKKFKGINIYDLIKNGKIHNSKEFTEAFLKACKNRGVVPRFADFSNEDGYYKLLLDFKMFDKNGNILMQENVRPDIDEELAKKILLEGKDRESQLKFSDDVVAEVKNRLSKEGVILNNSRRDDFFDAYEMMDESERFNAEEEKLKRDFEALVQKRVALNGKVNAEYVERAASSLINQTGSRVNRAELISSLTDLYKYMASMQTDSYDEFRAKLDSVASMIADEVKERHIDKYYKDMLKVIRSAKISLTEEQVQEAKNTFGNKWRNSFFGKVNITTDGTSLDSLWSQWAELYPEVFDADMKPNNQVTALLDIYNDAKDASEVVRTYNDSESVRNIALDVYEKFWTITKDWAIEEKNKAKVQKLNEEHRKAMRDIKDSMKKALENQRLADKMHYEKIIATIRRNRNEQIAEMNRLNKERKESDKERRARAEMVRKVTKNATDLMKILQEDSKDHHVPQDLKRPVMNMLNAINFSSKRFLNGGEMTQKDMSFAQAINELNKQVTVSLEAQENGGFIIDLPADFNDLVSDITDTINSIERQIHADNEYILNQMSASELDSLNTMLKTLKKSIKQMNVAIASRDNATISGYAQGIMRRAKKMTGKKHEDNMLVKFLTSSQLTPYFYFSHLGPEGAAIYRSFMDGWGKFAKNIDEIKAFAEATWSGEDVKAWEEDVKDFVIEVPLTNAEKAEQGLDADQEAFKDVPIRMTVPQIMSLYCLVKREQALGHILGGGIVINGFKENGKTTTKQKTIITVEEANRITSILDTEEYAKAKEVADKIQEYMNTTLSKWGNEISMKRFGIMAFTEANYFPITVDNDSLGTKAEDMEKASSIYRLLNMSFTKKLTQGANNALVIGDIFEIFTAHSQDMAKYNSIALPCLDLIKVLNYREVSKVEGATQKSDDSLSKALYDAYGDKCRAYAMQWLKDMNGIRESGRDTKIQERMLRNYKISAVAANVQVALLQPLSYIRAAYKIEPKYLSKALTMKNDWKNASQKVGIWKWKELGFYSTDVTMGLDKIIKQDETVMDKISDKAMFLASRMDNITWGYLYNASKAWVMDNTNLQQGTEEFDKAVEDKFNDIVYSTQVVDSTMTRSQIMRSNNSLAKLDTAFLAEPTVTYNMFLDVVTQVQQDYSQGLSMRRAVMNNAKAIRNSFAIFLISSVFESALRTGISLYREPMGDDENALKDILMRVVKEINPLSKIPWAKDFVSIFEGYDATRMDQQFAKNGYYFVNSLLKDIDNGQPSYKTIKRLVATISQTLGIPFSGALKEGVSIYNMIVRFIDPSFTIDN